jgi:hypothetical protein
MDSQKWMIRDGSCHEMDRDGIWMDSTRWMIRDGSHPDMDRGRIWMHDMRWVTGDRSQEVDRGRRMTINLFPFNEDITVIRSYTLLEITYFDFELRSCDCMQICRYTIYRRYCFTEYNTKFYSGHYSEYYPELPK